MIRSMTGYGKAMLETPQRKITVEIKSLNSKQADINTRLPWICKEKELDIRNMVIRKLERGKIDISIGFDTMDGEQAPVINKNNVRSYYDQMQEISSELGIKDNAGLLAIVMRLPETLRTEKPELTDDEWQRIAGLTEEALAMADLYRLEEGKAMEKDLSKSVASILNYLDNLGAVEGDRISRMREADSHP